MLTSFNWRALLISTLTGAVALPLLWNCIDYYPDDYRFWLLDPDVAHQRALLPFTYSAELYYGYGREEITDTSYRHENVLWWQSVTDKSIPEKDITDILYYTPAGRYFDKLYHKNNALMKFIRRPGRQNLLQYLDFAKTCESALSPDDPWSSDRTVAKNIAKGTLPKGQQLLTATAAQPELQRRVAWQMLRLYRLLGQKQQVRNTYEQYFGKKTEKDWLQAAAMYYYAQVQSTPERANIWYARAWQAGFYQRIWLLHAIDWNKEAATLSHPEATAADKAALLSMKALRDPGRCAALLEQIYELDPQSADLPKLISREVNKLENWLLTPKLLKSDFRFGLPQVEEEDHSANLRNDLAYLKEVILFNRLVMQDDVRSDRAFWKLTAAHLAWLNQDFGVSQLLANQALGLPDVPPQQTVQLKIIRLLSEIGEKGRISTTSENEIPNVFKAIQEHAADFQSAPQMAQKLALLLSDQFARQGQPAKAALMLGHTSEYYPQAGFPQARATFDYLLKNGSAEDFDQAIRMVKTPQGGFEQWMAGIPQRYSGGLTWDDATQQVIPEPGNDQWETERLYEFKAMYHLRKGQLENAVEALKRVPDTYWHRTGQSADYGHVYFKNNPFSVGIPVNGVPLTVSDTMNRYNKRTFLEQIIQLQKDNDPAHAQANALLLGNAWYNMSWYGQDWWLMLNPEKSMMDTEWNAENTDFDENMESVYLQSSKAREWYEKAARLNPNNDLGIAATYMTGRCEENRRYREFILRRKDNDEQYTRSLNPYFEQIKGKDYYSPLSCTWLNSKL